MDLCLTSLCHLQKVAHHAEAGDIGAGMDPVLYHNIPGVLVEGHHQPLGKGSCLLVGQAAL